MKKKTSKKKKVKYGEMSGHEPIYEFQPSNCSRLLYVIVFYKYVMVDLKYYLDHVCRSFLFNLSYYKFSSFIVFFFLEYFHDPM